MSEASSDLCLNCGEALHGEYCAACGQKAGPARVTLRDLGKQLIEESFELDGRVPRTLVPFFFKPGFLTREYNAGRRRSYTSPLRLFLAMGVLWVIVAFSIAQWRIFHPAAPVTEPVIQVESQDDPGSLVEFAGLENSELGRVIQERIDKFEALPNQERGARIRNAASDIPPAVALVLFPVFAIFLKLLLWRTRRTLPEHAVFALHVHAFGLFVMSFVRAIGDDRVIWLGFGVFGLYVLLALRHAYELRWWGTIWRWTLLAGAFVLITGAVFIFAVLGTAISA